MLQYIYAETGVAAQEIAQEVAPEVNSVTKEQIKDAAKERAEEIADDIAKAEFITQEQHSALVEACTQVIYTQVCGDLAMLQSCQNVESLFSNGPGHFKRNKYTYRAAAGNAVAGAVGGALDGLIAHSLTGKNKLNEDLSAKGLKYGSLEWNREKRRIRSKRAKKFMLIGAAGGGTIGAASGAAIGRKLDKASRY